MSGVGSGGCETGTDEAIHASTDLAQVPHQRGAFRAVHQEMRGKDLAGLLRQQQTTPRIRMRLPGAPIKRASHQRAPHVVKPPSRVM